MKFPKSLPKILRTNELMTLRRKATGERVKINGVEFAEGGFFGNDYEKHETSIYFPEHMYERIE